MRLLERTIKIVLAAYFAIILAHSIGLAYSSSAGIIAILSILDSRKTTFKVAWQRLFSVLLAFIIATIAFLVFGYSFLSLAIFLLAYVPISYRLGIEAGLAPSTVLVTHLLTDRSISVTSLGNELALFLVGVILALLLNLYMPSKDKEIQSFHNEVEIKLKVVLLKFEEFLLTGNGKNDALLIDNLDKKLNQALDLVYLDQKNHLFHQTNYQVHYFEMRQSQSRLLRQMATNINRCQLESDESLILADLFRKTALQLSEKNSGFALIEQIEEVLKQFRQRELPKSREEFEMRAILFQIFQDLERLIRLKVDFYRDYHLE